jgi:ABC-type enterochelin transport system permease subunit
VLRNTIERLLKYKFILTEVLMVTATFATIIGFGLIAAALATVFFSPYRHWLGFMFAGMIFWGVLEAMRFGVQNVFDMSVAYSYLTAISLAMMALTGILLREDNRAQKALANRQYIEHTPVYEDE